MTIFFIVILAISIGTLVEMVEYLQDIILGSNLQSSLDDTMIDLIADTLGGIIIAVPGYFYLEYVSTDRFVEKMKAK